MKQNSMLAMILAGGRGSRLHDLTNKVAKPAVSYGGKYRIVDFPLSNCANSGVDVVGVLTQYESIQLNSYVAAGGRWGLDAKNSGVYVLPPREKADENLNVYRGTADAISQNIDFIDKFDPEYVLVLSGDHIYKMNYDKMLAAHKEAKADATIAVIGVPMKEASRFGIMNTDESGRIVEFEEKPEHPKSNLASMGIYIFTWKLLRKMLMADIKNPDSSHDFGKDIIPTMLNDNRTLYAYKFEGYWKDVGTIDSLWEANMDLLSSKNELDLGDPSWKIYTEDVTALPQYISAEADVKDAYITQGCVVQGEVKHSVLFTGVKIGAGARIIDSVLMPGVVVEEGAVVQRALVADGVRIGKGAVVGAADSEHIELVAKRVKGQNNMYKAFGIVNSSGRNIYVDGMQDYRPIGAFSFLGRYRVIDFPISNMTNSNIERIQVYINNKPRSVVEHLGTGRHYNINSKSGKLQLLFSEHNNDNDIYNTDISCYLDNMESLSRMNHPYVVIAPSYMVYSIDFDQFLHTHIESGADVTLLYHAVDNAKEAYLTCNVLGLNRQKGVESIEPNHGNKKNQYVYMDTCVMKTELFISLIKEAKNLSSMYTLADILNDKCETLDIRGVAHKGFFASITDFPSYYAANMALLNYKSAQELFHDNWPIYTRTNDSCPTQYFNTADVKNSVISNGCQIEGTVENSVIGRGCVIKKGAVVRNSVVLAEVTIGEGVHVENEVVDKWAKLIHKKEIVSPAEQPGYIRRNDTL